MKNYLTILSILICHCVIHAQTALPRQIVYLKDGSTVRGTVTVNDSAGYVLVVGRAKESHYYEKAKVAARVPDTARYNFKRKGYQCNIEMGVTNIVAGGGGVDFTGFSFNIIQSYVISPISAIGMGIGTEIGNDNTEMFSIYTHDRTYFIKSDISPYFDVSFGYNGMFSRAYEYYYNYYGGIGYGSSLHLTTTHGFIFNPAFGLRVVVTKKIALNTSCGYKLYYYGKSNEAEIGKGNAVTIKLGFMF